MEHVILITAEIITTLLLTWGVREYALKNSLLDIPNERSSHKVSTPRGGGLAIVTTFSIITLYLFFRGSITLQMFLGLFVGGLFVAAVGFWDDHHSLSAKVRITVHFIAAIWLFYWVGGLGALPLLGNQFDLGIAGNVLGVIALVWLLNLYNFMDGIDGIAAIEAITILGCAVAILYVNGDVQFSLWLTALIFVCLGFLIWNWPPAKIFMGDVGSGFLGFTLGAFALITSIHTVLNVWTWLILLGVFLVDATVTLITRAARGAKWYDAHRSHAYQHAAVRYGSHKKVTVTVLLINVVWLLPWAWLSVEMPGWGVVFLLVAYLPLIGVAVGFGAGRERGMAEGKSAAASDDLGLAQGSER